MHNVSSLCLIRSLKWILENDITDIIYETFSMEVDKFGVMETIEFKPGGADIEVTEENKQEYVKLKVYYKFVKGIQEQMDAFLEGFYSLIPKSLFSVFDEKEVRRAPIPLALQLPCR